MTTLLLRVLERVHGHLGWFAVAALLHPAIVLSNPKRRARLAVALSAGLAATTGALGAVIYPPYRDRIKQHIFLDAPRVGWLFERKEHLAVGAITLALVGCVSHLCLPLVTDPAMKEAFARLAHRAFVGAAVLAVIVACLGVAVASFRTF